MVLSDKKVCVKTAYASGEGVFVNEDVGKGVLLMEERLPEVCIPDDAHLPEACSWCMAWKPSGGEEMWYTDSHKPLLQCTRSVSPPPSPLPSLTPRRCKTVKYCDQVIPPTPV